MDPRTPQNHDAASDPCACPTPGGPPADADIELASLAKALAHPVRVAILRRLLADGDCVCGDIVDGLPLAQSTVSQHLKILKESGLVRGNIDGPRVCYCADPAVVRRLGQAIRVLESFAGCCAGNSPAEGKNP